MTQRHISHPEPLPYCAAGNSASYINGTGKCHLEDHS